MEIVLAYALGLLVLWVVGYLLLVPFRKLGKLVLNAALGGLGIIVFNAVFSGLGVHFPVNLFTAFFVGVFGVPGIALVAAFTWLL